MNTKRIFKLMLDITMIVLYLLLMTGYDLGAFFHEVAGIGIGLLFIVHIALNGKETAGIAKAALRKNAPLKPKLFFYTDCLLTLSMFVTIISGVLISQVLFAFTSNDLLESLHNLCSYVALSILGGHALLHVKYIIGVVKNSARQKPSGFAKALRRFLATAAIVITAYVFAASAFNSRPVPTTNENDSSDEESVSSEAADSDAAATVTESTSTEEEVPTLDEYLSNLYCTACGRHCSLLSPACGKGSAQAAAAQVDYNEQYPQ